MARLRPVSILLAAVLVCAALPAARVSATGVPIGGFLPQVGIALTNEYKDDLDTSAAYSAAPGGTLLGQGGTAHYDVALMDSGAALSLLTAQSHVDFNMNGPYSGNPDGYQGTYTIPVGGANGFFDATIDDPVGLYAGGLQGVTGTSPLTINHNVLKGQTNTSLATMLAETGLPNVLGLTFVSQYATYIRNDLSQIQQINGRTVRSPAIEFNPIGGSNQGIARRAFVTLDPGASFAQPPFWFYDPANPDLLDKPYENPSIPTVVQGGIFLTTNLGHDGTNINNNQMLFDTGADVTVLSEQIAYSQLGLDPNHPDFTVAVTGAGGTAEGIPGYFLDTFTIQASGGGGNLTLTNVPIVVLDVPTPVDGQNTLPGIVGMNVFAGRNMVINPKAGTVAAGVYISDPVTNQKDWLAVPASGNFAGGGNWAGGAAPTNLSIANVRYLSGGDQTVTVGTGTTIWELNVSGGSGHTMNVQVLGSTTLTTFSGTNIESGGVLTLQNGNLDTQYVEILGGTLRGSGTIMTGSGQIPGQVENRSGTVVPGLTNGIGRLTVVGRFAVGHDGTLAMELGGLTAGTGYDQVAAEGPASIAGSLIVTLINGFTPAVGNAFSLVTATEGVGGAFGNLTLPAGYNWRLEYGDDSVKLVVGLPGDFNDNGIVDAADYTIWRNTLGSTTVLDADGNGNGQIDSGDFTVWKSTYGAIEPSIGSGSGLGNGSVPEPASIGLVLLGALIVGLAPPRRVR